MNNYKIVIIFQRVVMINIIEDPPLKEKNN